MQILTPFWEIRIGFGFSWEMALNPSSRMDSQTAAEKAVSVIGLGYDLTSDIRLTACKIGPNGYGLIEIDQKSTKDLLVPGGVVVSNVSTSIKCDKGERTRFRSDALSFSQVNSLFQFFHFKFFYRYLFFSLKRLIWVWMENGNWIIEGFFLRIL